MSSIWIAVSLATAAFAYAVPTAPSIGVLGRTYQLASFHQKPNAMWEFVVPGENINDWKTLVTLIDRPDAHSQADLDRLAEGIDSNYKSHGGRILLAKTMRDHSGEPYNYLVVAFEEPTKHRFELNFVKVASGPKNAYVLVYGAASQTRKTIPRRARSSSTSTRLRLEKLSKLPHCRRYPICRGGSSDS
jgi:hypothetical protein